MGNFKIQIIFVPSGWVRGKISGVTLTLDSSESLVKEIEYGETERIELTKVQIYRLRKLINVLNSESLPSGRIGGKIYDVGSITLNFESDKMSRSWMSNRDWGNRNETFIQIIELLAHIGNVDLRKFAAYRPKCRKGTAYLFDV